MWLADSVYVFAVVEADERAAAESGDETTGSYIHDCTYVVMCMWLL